jgi:hypothetical protein
VIDDESVLLTEVAKLAAGEGDPPALSAALLGARLYCVRPEYVGFEALGVPGDGMIPVFTSPEELVRWTGRETPWFAMAGADLVAQFPDGYDLVLNLAGEHPVRLHARLWLSETTAETDHGGMDG